MGYFIACDIDHTLLNDKGELLSANVKALREAQDAGATVVLATARSFVGAKPIHQALKLDTPLVVSNGTLVYDPDGRVLMTQAIEAETARRIVTLFRDTPHHWSFRTGDGALIHPDFDTSRPPFSSESHYQKTPHEALEDSLRDSSTLVTATLFGQPLREFFDAHDWPDFPLVADYYPPSHYNSLEAVSVMSVQASKGRAVAWLRDYLGLAQAPTLCMGDSIADASMFCLGTGVAPANAAPEALVQATWIGPHCDDGMVAAALNKYVLGRNGLATK